MLQDHIHTLLHCILQRFTVIWVSSPWKQTSLPKSRIPIHRACRHSHFTTSKSDPHIRTYQLFHHHPNGKTIHVQYYCIRIASLSIRILEIKRLYQSAIPRRKYKEKIQRERTNPVPVVDDIHQSSPIMYMRVSETCQAPCTRYPLPYPCLSFNRAGDSCWGPAQPGHSHHGPRPPTSRHPGVGGRQEHRPLRTRAPRGLPPGTRRERGLHATRFD